MNTELEYLSELINMIDNDGDERSRKKLWSLIGILAKKEIGELNEKEISLLVSEVHELNIEQIIKVQAQHFYNEFAFVEIRERLIEDFIEMEHCRRRDDFEGFSLAAFQQIENIVNYIFLNTNIWERARINKDLKLLSSASDKTKRFGVTLGEQLVYSVEKDKTEQIGKLFSKQINLVDFSPKFKVVLYFSYFNENVQSYDDWNRVHGPGYDLYLSRNQNHRGTINTESQAKRQDKIIKNKYNYYLLFSGYLADFITKINLKYKVNNIASV